MSDSLRRESALQEAVLAVSKLDLNVILNMPAGPEMDALVAKEVLGYAIDFEEWPSASGDSRRIWFVVSSEHGVARTRIPKYSTDIEAAWAVGKKMRSLGNALSLQHRHMIDDVPGTAIWTAWFGRANDLAWAVTPPLAICRAALLAIRGSNQVSAKIVTGNLFSIIEHELAKIMGPIAPLIVSEKIAEFGESRDGFPENRVDSFLKALGEEIPDEGGRASFDAAMAEFLLPKRRSSDLSSGKIVTGNLFSIIEHELAKIMGPIALTMVSEKIAEFGESRDGFPENRVDSFLKALEEEIPDTDERASFATAMAEVVLIKRRRP